MAPEPEIPTVTAQTYKVKVANEEVDVPLEELLKGYSRTGDYTKKSMALAAERKAHDAERQQFDQLRTSAKQREEQLASFLKDATQVKAYYDYLTAGQPQGAPQGPDPIQQQLTATRQQLEAQVQALQQGTQQELHKVQQVMQQRQAAEYSSTITKTINAVMEKPDLKILKSLGDDVAEILCNDAMRLNPSTIEEATAAIIQAAEARAEHLNTQFKEMLKASATSQAKLKSQGIEPPGGTGVVPAPTKHSLGSKDLTKAATEWVQSQMTNRK